MQKEKETMCKRIQIYREYTYPPCLPLNSLPFYVTPNQFPPFPTLLATKARFFTALYCANPPSAPYSHCPQAGHI